MNRIVLGLVFIWNSISFADQFHYQNLIIGDRAVGMGGAYAGVADDSSGVYYNPAGLGFALSNDLSGNANAFYNRKVVYKDVLPGFNYEENSRGGVPSFFGGLQKLDSFAKGLVFAFGIYSTDSDLLEQDDRIKKSTLRFHRTLQSRGGDNNIAAGLGYRISNNVAIGAALNYVTFDSLSLDFQYSGQFGSKVSDDNIESSNCSKLLKKYKENNTVTDGILCFSVLNQNKRISLLGKAIKPSLGVQIALFQKLSLGLSFSAAKWISQELIQTLDVRKDTTIYKVDGQPVSGEENNIPSDVINESASGKTTLSKTPIIIESGISTATVDKPFGSDMQYSGRFGAAYFASPRLLLTADAMYYGGVTDAKIPDHNFNSVMNYAVGAEWYPSPSFPLRFGFFTNNDNRSKPNISKKILNDYVNYKGASAFFSWVQPNSQVGAGLVYQAGEGFAAKTGTNASALNKVEAVSTTVAISAAHSF